MADSTLTLGLSPGADEATVRRRYLELVRRFPPEKHPEQFAAIRRAYEELSDPVARLRRRIFEPKTLDSIEDMAADLRAQLAAKRIPTETLLALAEG